MLGKVVNFIMAIKRKGTEIKLNEPKIIQRTRKIRVDMKTLTDAFVNNKLNVPLNQRVYFERINLGKTATHEGTITAVTDNCVTLYDHTIDQFVVIDQTVSMIKIAPE